MLTGAVDTAWFSAWRRRELARFDAIGLTYLDYTGAAPFPESVVAAEPERLLGGVLGNPHSEHLASRRATNDLDAARAAILDFLGAASEEYQVVLTANATAAIRLVAESFPFGPDAPLVLSQDNHNSVNGIREFAASRGAQTTWLPLDHDLRLAVPVGWPPNVGRGGLFAYPAQSNFSGVRHPLSLVADAQARGLRVLLDAASFLHAGSIDFRVARPDFIVLSVYKIAGYPSGIGALVARPEALAELQRPWFAGGTVDWVMTSPAGHQLKAGAERFEDGTPSFVAAGAVPPALRAVGSVNREHLAEHLRTLTERLLVECGGLQHPTGHPVVAIHGPTTMRDRGATIAFSVLNPRGEVVPFWEVEVAARDAGLALRGGCFCNPGCAERAFSLGTSRMADGVAALGEDFTIPRLAARLGTNAVGALRVSFGLGSTMEDVSRVVDFLRRFRDG
jgi:selenocysteine lyase/cysteine desulfurase